MAAAARHVTATSHHRCLSAAMKRLPSDSGLVLSSTDTAVHRGRFPGGLSRLCVQPRRGRVGPVSPELRWPEHVRFRGSAACRAARGPSLLPHLRGHGIRGGAAGRAGRVVRRQRRGQHPPDLPRHRPWDKWGQRDLFPPAVSGALAVAQPFTRAERYSVATSATPTASGAFSGSMNVAVPSDDVVAIRFSQPATTSGATATPAVTPTAAPTATPTA